MAQHRDQCERQEPAGRDRKRERRHDPRVPEKPSRVGDARVPTQRLLSHTPSRISSLPASSFASRHARISVGVTRR